MQIQEIIQEPEIVLDHKEWIGKELETGDDHEIWIGEERKTGDEHVGWSEKKDDSSNDERDGHGRKDKKGDYLLCKVSGGNELDKKGHVTDRSLISCEYLQSNLSSATAA